MIKDSNEHYKHITKAFIIYTLLSISIRYTTDSFGMHKKSKQNYNEHDEHITLKLYIPLPKISIRSITDYFGMNKKKSKKKTTSKQRITMRMTSTSLKNLILK